MLSAPRHRPLKVGVVLPCAEGTMVGATPRWADLLAMAQRAEAVGFDSVWVPDHLLFRPLSEGAPPLGIWECWSVLAALAAATQRLELGTLVLCAGFRNPALLAKMADTVDEISAGRLILGLGAGWNELEHRAFGYPFDHRVGRFAEALPLVRALLREGGADVAGAYHQAQGAELRPRGPRPGGPPLLVGSIGERMLRLTARYADGWNAWAGRSDNRPEGIAPLRAAVDAACAAEGRDPATLWRTAAVLVEGAGAAPFPPGMPGWSVGQGQVQSGSTERLAALFRAYAAEGISHLQVWVNPTTVAGIEQLAPVLQALDRG
jgi:alkanesulfonate monooxygenase SsuD/methylene tetrahydromethanopterin reductase-like flavin-dependent oxidoreductase (luciferase family)